MTCFSIFRTYRTPFFWRGIATGLLLFVLVLPGSVQGQAPVQSLIEQGRSAGTDADLMQTVASRAQEAGMSAEATANLLTPAVRLAEQDLPATPLLNKTLEGLAKQVPAQQMTPVLQRFQDHTQQAGALVSRWGEREAVQRMLGESNGPPAKAERDQLITNIAEAQQQDLPLEHVEQFLEGLPEATQRRPIGLSEVSTAVSVMPDLPAAQDRPDLAQQVLTAALNAEYDAQSLRQLPAALEQAQQASQRPAPAIARGTAQAISRGTPAGSVLRNLFQGTLPGGGPPSGVGEGSPGSPPGQGKPPGENGQPPGTPAPDDPANGPPDDTPADPPTGDG